MPGSALFPLRVAILAGLVLTAAASLLPAQERVGINSAVNPQATGTPPGGAARRLVIGQDVVFNEHITTTEGGQTQLLFVDESSMTVGPNSDLVIDQFVYDPRTGTGKLAMTATRGLLRYVGGKLSKQDDAVTLRTATATLAVRGGAFIAQIDPAQTEAAFLYGKGLTVTGTTGASETLIRPGFQVTVSGIGGIPSRPAPMPPGQLALFTQRLDGRTGSSGGAKTVPTEAAVASSGISQTISGDVSQSVQQATANQGATQLTPTLNPIPTVIVSTVQSSAGQGSNTGGGSLQPPVNPPPPGNPHPSGGVAGQFKDAFTTTTGFTNAATSLNPFTGSFQNGVLSANSGSLSFTLSPLIPGATTNVTAPNSFGNNAAGPATMTADGGFFFANLTNPTAGDKVFFFGGTPVAQSFFAPTPTQQFLAFNVQPDYTLANGAQAQTIPFLPSNFGGTMANATVSPLLVATSPNEQFGISNILTHNDGLGPKWLQASLAVNGQGANQTSALVVGDGGFVTSSDNGQVVVPGDIRGTVSPSATSPVVGIFASTHSVPDANGNSLFGGNTLSGFVLDQNGSTITGNFAQNMATANPFGGTSVNYAFNQPVTTAGTFAPGARSALAETGFFGGIMTHTTTPTTGSPYVLFGTTAVVTDPVANRVAATFAGADPFTAAQSGISSMVLNFGSLSSQITANYNRSAFIDNNNYVALESPVTPSQINGNNLPTLTTAANPTVNAPGSAPVNSGLTNLTPSLAMVTSATVPNTSWMPAGVTPCACQYLQWGYWTGQVQTPNAALTAATRNDRAFINTWIAGMPTPVGDLNTLAAQAVTGTYTGAAIGTVFNNGASYLAAGAYNGSYNFGTQIGTVAISNFDGKSFSTSGRAPLTGANYTFAVTPTASSPVAGTVNGTFYGPLAAETGGNFAVHAVAGPTYLASGIFAGKR
jgi:hypothetical protein